MSTSRRWHASRPIDFFVYGVPRSGTTAIARALSEHPDAICFNEVLNASDNKLTLGSADRRCATNRQRSKQRRLIHKAIVSPRPVLIGNKNPNHFLALRNIVKLRNNSPIVLTYRSPEGFVGSWNARADDVDDNWSNDMRGVFGIGDQILCFAAAVVDLQEVDVLVVPHVALASARTNTLNAITDHLDLGRFGDATSEKPWSPRRTYKLDTTETQALQFTNAEAIDCLLSQDAAYPLSSIRASLIDELKKIPQNFPEQLHKLAVDAYALEESKFAAKWLARRKLLWGRLVKAINPDLGRV